MVFKPEEIWYRFKAALATASPIPKQSLPFEMQNFGLLNELYIYCIYEI